LYKIKLDPTLIAYLDVQEPKTHYTKQQKKGV